MSKEIKFETTKSTAIAVLHDARCELRSAADGGVELAEKLAGGLFRFAKKLTQRLDESTGHALDGVERRLSSSKKSREERNEAKKAEKAEKAAAKQTKRADKAA